MDTDNLDVYYEDCVVGGPGAFVIPMRERKQFIEAPRAKLVTEISGRQLKPRVMPASAQAPRISCTSARRCGKSAGAATISSERQRANLPTISTWNE